MRVVPYLNFDGKWAEAFRFCEQVLGGKIEVMMTHGETPIAGEVPPGWEDRIMHARLVAGNVVLMGSDSPPEHHEDREQWPLSSMTRHSLWTNFTPSYEPAGVHLRRHPGTRS
jgi:PhnB protein